MPGKEHAYFNLWSEQQLFKWCYMAVTSVKDSEGGSTATGATMRTSLRAVRYHCYWGLTAYQDMLTTEACSLARNSEAHAFRFLLAWHTF